jgi:flagellar hook-length control protein FliK
MRTTGQALSPEQAVRSPGGTASAGERQSALGKGEPIGPERAAAPEERSWPTLRTLPAAPEPADCAGIGFASGPQPLQQEAASAPVRLQELDAVASDGGPGRAPPVPASAEALPSGLPDAPATITSGTTASTNLVEAPAKAAPLGSRQDDLEETAAPPTRRFPPLAPAATPLPSGAGIDGDSVPPPPSLSLQPEMGPTPDAAPPAPAAGAETEFWLPQQASAAAQAETGISAAPSPLQAPSGARAPLASARPRPPIGEIGPSAGARSAPQVSQRADGDPWRAARPAASDARVAAPAPRSDEISSKQPADAQILRFPPPSGGPGGALAVAPPPTGIIGDFGAAVARAPEGIVAIEQGAHSAARQVALQITRLDHDRTEIRIQLDPPELGEVDIQLEFRELRLSATVSAERPDTLDLLQRDARSLVRALREAGVELADSDLSFASGGRHDRPDAGASGQRPIHLAPALAPQAPLRNPPFAAAPPHGLVSLSEGRLDLRV